MRLNNLLPLLRWTHMLGTPHYMVNCKKIVLIQYQNLHTFHVKRPASLKLAPTELGLDPKNFSTTCKQCWGAGVLGFCFVDRSLFSNKLFIRPGGDATMVSTIQWKRGWNPNWAPFTQFFGPWPLPADTNYLRVSLFTFCSSHSYRNTTI